MTSRSPHRLSATAALSALALGALAGAAGSVATAPEAHAATPLTITPNPRYENTDFEGWGTSLVWFANATGAYPEELRESLYQAVFGEDGLDLNIARYNIGGQNATDVEDYLRPGGAVDGWWAEDPDGSAGTYGGAATDYASRAAVREAFDPADPSFYDVDADATQRWWIDRLVDDGQITHWEAFANSAPYFMTESGYVSGGFDSSAEQLRPDSIEDFALYLATVTDLLEDAHGIEFDTIDPLNEPNTNYWGTTLSGGVPVGGRQEGMHVGPERQAELIDALAAALADESISTQAGISAPDETNPGIFVQDWAAYDAQTRAHVEQMNVHTYGTGGRLQVRDLASQADKPLWMSEVEGSWVSGWNPTAIENGLGLAGRIHDDLRELEADAWVLWQPVEDLYNMEPQGENLNWGSVFIDLDCQPYDVDGQEVWLSERRVADAGGDTSAVEPCEVQVNTKFNAMRHFTQYIHAGDSIIPTDSTATTAALAGDADRLTLVHSNAAAEERAVTIDLSRFGSIEPGATATAYVTTESPSDDVTQTALVPAAPVAVDAGSQSVTVTLPAQSLASIVIDGVSGVAEEAPGLVDGHTYQLEGVQSSLMLDSSSGRLRIEQPATDAATAGGQAWTVHTVEPNGRDDISRVVLTDADGRVMGATSADTDLRDISVAQAVDDPETRWVVNTLDGTTFSLVNESLAAALDVGGQATSAGSTVGWWTSSGGANQRWIARDLAPQDVTLALQTDAGVEPQLPATVSPEYAWGTAAAVPVTWDAPDPSVWDSEGRVDVPGQATDVFGTDFSVTAQVDVGGFTATDPRSLTTYAGASLAAVQAAAPQTVPARVGASSQALDVPVVWDWDGIADAAFASPGTVTVPGTAQVGDGVDATLTVIVTTASALNINPDEDTDATATSTEPGYPVDRTRNQVVGDKGWSNWVGSNKPTQDTLTYAYPELQSIERVAVHFYADGSASSWAQSTAIEYRGTDGEWRTVPGLDAIPLSADTSNGAPSIDESFAPVTGDAVRVVLNAFPNTHMVVSEVEVYALAPSASTVASLATLRVDGVEVDGFDPEMFAYQVVTEGEAFPTVSAIATDEDATVSIQQASADNGSQATVTVTAADGETTTTSTVDIERVIGLDVALAAAPVAGSEVAATVTASPQPDSASYQWYADDAPVAGADAETFTPGTDMIGQELAVEVTVTAQGFDPVTERSQAQVIAAPQGWADVGLASVTVGDGSLDGYTDGTDTYVVAVSGSALPQVQAEAASTYASVTVEQATTGDPVARVTITAGDGTVRVVQITFDRSVRLSTPVLSAAIAGGTASVTVEADPADAALEYRWTLDGDVVGTDSTLELPLDSAGASLAVSVTASAPAFTSSTRASGALEVQRPEGIDPVVELSASQVEQGGTVEVTGTGSLPGGEVRIELHSTPVELATVQADADGAFTATVTIPASTQVGAHQVVITDVASGLSAAADIEVVAADDGAAGEGDGGSGAGALSGTGPDDAVALLAAAALAMAAAGAALALAARRRSASVGR